MEKKVHNFTVVIEQDEDGYYVGDVPALRGCYTQGKTMDELLKNMKEVILLCLETEEEIPKENFVGVQQVQVVA
ncbi:MAG: type II toxin-antitoxin system HicB family antitoxin [Nanoarchaeota archaeon]